MSVKTRIFETERETLEAAAAELRRFLAAKPAAVLALSAGQTALRVYEALERLGGPDLSRAWAFSVAEFEDVPEELSCRRALERSALFRLGLREENCVFLSRETLEDYDERIAAAGGLDLAVLGLGVNAAIGCNEPATPYDSPTHRQKLTDASRRHLAGRFGGEERAPETALTMGIHTLVSAGETVLAAVGAEKAQAAHRMVYGRSESYSPASFLQLPREVSAFFDRAAGEQLA